MRLTRFAVGSVLLALAAVLAAASLGAAMAAHRAAADRAAEAAAVVEPDEAGLALSADLALVVGELRFEQGVDLAPQEARALPLPGLTARRDVDAVPVDAPVDATLGLDLATGSHRATREAGADQVATQSSAVAVASPPVALALAAAALAGAGLLALLWTPLKAGLQKVVVLPVVALYAKVSRAEVFENEVRERIFAAIRERPGVAATDLARAANVAWGTTIYHLDVLEQTRMVTSVREGRHRRYFVNGAPLEASKEAVAILQNTTTAAVVEQVRTAPGVTQKELAAATNMSPQALHWHLARLVGAGLVRKERAGRVVKHFPAAG